MSGMRTSLTGVERTFGDDEFIISKTDLKGRIIYANPLFISLSGYQESDLLGKPHNIIRHPDMPRCVFKLLWERISNKSEILAYVINRAKNGDHYWVFAHVTPSYNAQGEVVGYLSGRRSPNRDAVEKIKELYKILLAEENKHNNPTAAAQAGYDLLMSILKEKDVSYDEFVFTL